MLACERLTTRLEARGLGWPEEAARYFEQALAIFEEVGAVDSARVVYENLDVVRRELT